MNDPFLLPAYDEHEVLAIKALSRGEATDGQQKLAVRWLLNEACRVDDMSIKVGSDGTRLTDFSEGRRFVGLQFIKLMNMDLRKMEQNDGPGDRHPKRSRKPVSRKPIAGK